MKISQFFRDDTGALSSTRLVFITWSVGLFVLVAYQTLVEKKLPVIDNSLVALFGVVTSGKVVQSFSENK